MFTATDWVHSMKSKRHVRSEWRLIEPPVDYKRVRTLCKVTSTPDNCGVPGITKEATSGWCSRCIKILATEVRGNEVTLPTLQSLYNVITAEVGRHLGRESPVLPLWHPHSESINNRRWIVWDMMMDRCYNQTNEDYLRWGGQGLTVHPDWHNFKQFADDMPDDVIGVYPKHGKEISKSNSIVRVEGST